jgi:hypothetical protein
MHSYLVKGEWHTNTTRHPQYKCKAARRCLQNWYGSRVLFATTKIANASTDHSFPNLKIPFSLDIQQEYIKAWKSVDQKAEISIQPFVEEAVSLVKKIGNRDNGMQALVTGSLYLVDGALFLLHPNILE